MRWVPTTEATPKEHDSFFEKLRRVNKLPKELLHMHEKESDTVIITVEVVDGDKGEKFVTTGKTKDGKWDTGYKLEGQKVIAWIPFPEPWEGD